MSIRLRTVNGIRVAVCAARSIEQSGDLYLDDADHHALTQKFTEDFVSEGFIVANDLVNINDANIRLAEESNNPNREWWDKTYG